MLPLVLLLASSGNGTRARAQPDSPMQPGVVPRLAQPGITVPPRAVQPGATVGVVPDPPVLPARPMVVEYAPPHRPRAVPPPRLVPAPAATPYAPVEAPDATIRLGDFLAPKPDWVSAAQAHSVNVWAAYGEWRIARFWADHGLSGSESDRRAATATTGAVIGGVTAGAAAVIPVAVVGGAAGALAGAAVGATIGCAATAPSCAPGAGPGALIGAAVGGLAGAAALAAVGAVAAGLLGAVVGGVIANAVGAGNPDSLAANAVGRVPGLVAASGGR
jgi:hypothetical protein